MAAHIDLPPGTVLVATIQYQPVFGEVERNLDEMHRLVRQAAQQGAKIVVLPELADTGYVFENVAELASLADRVPGGRSATSFVEIARELGILIAVGLAERDGASFYNTALLAGPDGFIGKYRKLHLWNREKLYFAAGDLGLPVFDTPMGRIGLAICYDAWFPETFRALALDGATMACVPTNWVPMAGQASDTEPMANILVRASAHSNGLVIAAADRVGVERGQKFIGRSIIVGPDGLALAGPASADAPEVLFASISLGAVSSSRRLSEYNDVLTDRREDVYGIENAASRKQTPKTGKV